MEFKEFELHEKLLEGIADAGFAECMPVQAEALPHTLAGRDVCVQAQTGTGKTAAFLITIFQRLVGIATDRHTNRALVIVPTRELALQVEEEALLLGRHLDIKVGCFYGGVGYGRQEKHLDEKVEVIIGTPGRLIDFMRQQKINFKEFRQVVIDEADRLFDMGFVPDIRRMMRQMLPYNRRQTMLWSATLTTRVKQLAWEYMNEAVEIVINPEQITVDRVTQELYHVSKREKFPLLLGVLKQEQPHNALIFTNTKQAAYEVAKRLQHNGYNAAYLIGDLAQSRRVQTLEDFKEGKTHLLVATEVAARGLHIENLGLVVNYDLPEDSEDYVHRIGRTARVDKSGKAISLVCERFVYGLEALEKFIKQEIPVVPVTDELIEEDRSAGMEFRLRRDGDRRTGRDGAHQRREKKWHRRGDRKKAPGGQGNRRGEGRPGSKQDDLERLNKFLDTKGGA